jgi:uncharacterized protein YoxC
MQDNNSGKGGLNKKVLLIIAAAVAVSFVMMVAVVGAVAYAVHVRMERQAQEKREIAELADGLKKQAEAIRNIQEGGTDTSAFDAAVPTGQSVVVKFQVLISKFMKEAALEQVAFNKQIEESGLPKLLDADRLSTDKDLSQSREILARARKISADFQGKMREMLKRFRASMDTLKLTPEQRRGLLDGMDKGMNGSMKRTEQIWALDLRMLGDMDKIIDLLAKKPRAWHVAEGQILFDQTADLTAYNSLLESIQKDSQEQISLQKEAMNNVETGVNQMKQGK